MSQVKITRENIAAQLSEEFGVAYTTAYKKIDLILNLWANSLIAVSYTHLRAHET